MFLFMTQRPFILYARLISSSCVSCRKAVDRGDHSDNRVSRRGKYTVKNNRSFLQYTVRNIIRAVDRGDHSDNRVSRRGKYTVKNNRK